MHRLHPRRCRAARRRNVNYTSSLAVQQRYQQDILQTSNREERRRQRHRQLGRASISATAEKNDTFYGEDSLTTTGGLPRVTFSRGERQSRGKLTLLRREQ